MLPGLASTVVLAVIATALESGSLERDVATRVSAGLAAAGQDWAVVTVSGRDVSIGGLAPSEEAQRLALVAASEVPGVGSVGDRSELLELVTPYVWSATRLGRKVTLAGYVPSFGARNALLAAARRSLPDAEILDDMKLARGAPPGFGASTAFALERLGDLGEGLAAMTDATLAVKGSALSSDSYARARRAFSSEVPSAVVLGPVDITPARADPFVWSASFDGEAVLIAGFVPNDVVKDTLVTLARAAIPGASVTDETTIASGEPGGFAEAATFAIGALGRMRQGGVMLDGLTLDMAGEARSVDDYQAIVNGVDASLPEGLVLVASEITPARVDSYGWSGRKDGNSVVLTGYVPTLASRDAVVDAAESIFAGLSVDDQVKVAAGEPKMDWIGAIKFAMEQLAELERGTIELGDRTYTIEGEARDSTSFRQLVETNSRTLPASLELSHASITPPQTSPYVLSARRDGNKVILAGYAPSQSDKADLIETAQRLFGDVEVEDDIAFGSGAPPDFATAAAVAMDAAARLAGGRAEMTDTRIKVKGEVFFDHAMHAIETAATEAVPDGYSLDLTIMTRQIGQPLDPAQCRDRLQSDLKTGRIEFDGGKATLLESSLSLLDRVAGTLLRCGDAGIEVAAHADSDGSAEQNRTLTQARAETVVDYLVDAGVKRERLTAMGYGEDNPIADNATEEGKRANRRIEFAVQLPDGG
ncbi:MAG: OmpA family protein [Rhizobiales bacterium]|nr:OmpA family protein [Hyphomicrobiales bacterium]